MFNAWLAFCAGFVLGVLVAVGFLIALAYYGYK